MIVARGVAVSLETCIALYKIHGDKKSLISTLFSIPVRLMLYMSLNLTLLHFLFL